VIEEGFIQEMNSIPDLADRVFPLANVGQPMTPYGIYISGVGESEKTLNGYLTKQETELDFFVFHSSYGDLKRVMELVVNKIKSFIGRELGTSGILVQDVSYQSEPEHYEEQAQNYLGRIKIRLSF
jgi:hypothetical protein